MALLEIEKLNFTYNSMINTKKRALDNINLSISKGDFVVLCGATGSGKSTLLKMIKKELRPIGKVEGKILLDGVDVLALDSRSSASKIGFVMQNPNTQIVTDKVWHELAFGLENLGEKKDVIRRRVAEISGFFGISSWYHKDTSILSGGEKQLLNLASIMVMQPDVLLLDEPTSQLDPISATSFLNSIKKINSDLGITIILVEHNLEDVYSFANKIVVMDEGKILYCDTPEKVSESLLNTNNKRMIFGLPSPVRIYNALGINCPCPLTINEGKNFIVRNYYNDINEINIEKNIENKEVAIEVKDAYFRYEKDSANILNGLNLKVYKGEICCIVGANGVGKSTLLKIINGNCKLQSGKIKIFGENKKSSYKISTLPQNPNALFLCEKVIDELEEISKLLKIENANERIKFVSEKLEIENLYNTHPYDLSGGEAQKVALTKILLINPDIILLDEPTKGLDGYSKLMISEILKKLKEEGKTIIIVTHDIEFAGMYADRCAMYFDGEIVSIDNRVDFFTYNNYYTTSASRMSRPYFKNAITVDMVIDLCKKNKRKEYE